MPRLVVQRSSTQNPAVDIHGLRRDSRAGTSDRRRPLDRTGARIVTVTFFKVASRVFLLSLHLRCRRRAAEGQREQNPASSIEDPVHPCNF
jgi:hypothetical protein